MWRAVPTRGVYPFYGERKPKVGGAEARRAQRGRTSSPGAESQPRFSSAHRVERPAIGADTRRIACGGRAEEADGSHARQGSGQGPCRGSVALPRTSTGPRVGSGLSSGHPAAWRSFCPRNAVEARACSWVAHACRYSAPGGVGTPRVGGPMRRLSWAQRSSRLDRQALLPLRRNLPRKPRPVRLLRLSTSRW